MPSSMVLSLEGVHYFLDAHHVGVFEGTLSHAGVSGRVVGVQVGGAWTDGTGSAENAVCVDGRISQINEDLAWEYDRGDWMAPWRITASDSGRVDLVLTPFHVRTDRTNLGLLANDTHQAFGTWSGTMVDDDGDVIRCDGVRGWAEEVVNRW